MVDCDGFENHCTVRYRGFESSTLRHLQNKGCFNSLFLFQNEQNQLSFVVKYVEKIIMHAYSARLI